MAPHISNSYLLGVVAALECEHLAAAAVVEEVQFGASAVAERSLASSS